MIHRLASFERRAGGPAAAPATTAPRRHRQRATPRQTRRSSTPGARGETSVVRRLPPAAAGAPLESGTLRIDADVPKAQVFIDRQFVGTTPLTAGEREAGDYQVNVTAEGFDGIAQTIDVEPGPRDLTFSFPRGSPRRHGCRGSQAPDGGSLRAGSWPPRTVFDTRLPTRTMRSPRR